jgi:putative ABC transport system permease protein
MFISVNERKREIGIKKAIGASKLQIGTEFFLEGILISLGGCFLGIFFSFVLINVVNLYFPNFNLEISKQTASLAISISIILGSVFSIVPSLKAACKRPVACLKIE